MRPDAPDLLRQAFAQLGADALLVSSPGGVRYLSGFSSPEDGRVLLTEDSVTLVTDGRYTAQAQAESRIPVHITNFSSERLPQVAELAKGKKLAVEAEHLTVADYKTLQDALEHILPTKGLVEELRIVKTAAELDQLREAARLADDAFTHILTFIKVGKSEVEVALELEAYLRRAGAERISFDITVASGERGAFPHGGATAKILENGNLITLDFGAVVGGYHSDMTRTVALGEVSEAHEALHAAVLAAQKAALAEIKAGVDAKAVDAAARDLLTGQNLAQYFSHSLGHGVGLDVHEAPTLTPRKSFILQENMCVTVEPGVYIPGDTGVRIEDLVIVQASGYENLCQSDKSLIKL